MPLKTLKDLPDLHDKTVFVRVDFNVPLDKEGSIKDDKRIRHALPTLNYLLDHGAKQLILGTHVGRPKNNEAHLKTGKIAEHLQELLSHSVAKVDDWGEKGLPEAKVVMLENLRFHPGEKSKEETQRDAFGQHLASLAGLYVNEAFSNSHRQHASMTSIPKFIPSYAGLGVEDEVNQIHAAIQNPDHPLVAVIGGLKADKLTAVDSLLNVADKVLIAGALAYSLRKAQGYNVGSSKVDEEGMSNMKTLVEKILTHQNLLLPSDAVVADQFSAEADFKTVSIDFIEEDWMALDIGPKTIKTYVKEIQQAKTVLWFGPIGVFEFPATSRGTQAIGQAIADLNAVSIVGGGDSANAIKHFNLEKKITLVSTGGGASLKMIEGEDLPALKVLEK